MKMRLIFFQLIFVLGTIWITVLPCPFAQEIRTDRNGLYPPPADISFTLENTPQAGNEAVLKLKVTPLEGIHAEISCLLPEGIKPVREKGLIVRPCRERRSSPKQLKRGTTEEIVLYIGPLTADTTKEFLFRVIIPAKGRYELIASVDALAKWGVKEEALVIDIE